MIDPRVVAEELTSRFGLRLAGDLISEALGPTVRLRPVELPATQGFQLDATVGWRTIKASFQLGSFASPLLRSMEAAGSQQRVVFTSFARAAQSAGSTIRLSMNGTTFDPLSPQDWPATWTAIEIQATRTPVAIDLNDPPTATKTVVSVAVPVLGMAIALMPVESDAGPQADTEGATTSVTLDRFERSRVNRMACIAIQGVRCKVCGFDFAAVYGSLGEGYVEVHHLVQLADVAAPHVVDPAIDLIPVCSNCHSMLHRKREVMAPEQLRGILQEQAARAGRASAAPQQ